jgi:hypothetical protein
LQVVGEISSGAVGTNGSISLRRTSDGASINAISYDSATEEMRLNNGSGNGRIVFQTVSTERARIDSSGRLLVGTSSGRGVGESALANIQIETAGNAPSLSIVNNENTVASPSLKLGKSRGATNGSSTIVQSGDSLGAIIFAGADGTNLETAGAYIIAQVDGTPGADDMPGRLVFSTSSDNSASPTERMRITSGGYLWINRTTDPSTANSLIAVAGGATNLCAIFDRTVNDDSVRFTRSETLVGSISVTTTATAYNTSSDYRLKENVVSLTGATDRVKQLKPSQFNFIADPDTTVDGFIAHEAQAVVPECVTGEKDAVDEDGNPKYQGIDQSKLVPLLTAALQEAITEIASLKDRVAALEGV